MYSSVDDLQLARPSAGSASGDAQPSANASQSAALTSAQQALVDDIKSFGRMPVRKKATSAEDRAENNLAKRYDRLEKGFPLPEHIKQELRVLGGAQSTQGKRAH